MTEDRQGGWSWYGERVLSGLSRMESEIFSSVRLSTRGKEEGRGKLGRLGLAFALWVALGGRRADVDGRQIEEIRQKAALGIPW